MNESCARHVPAIWHACAVMCIPYNGLPMPSAFIIVSFLYCRSLWYPTYSLLPDVALAALNRCHYSRQLEGQQGMHCTTYDVVATCPIPLELAGKSRRGRSRGAEHACMQHKSSGKAMSPPTARVWVNATWSPDVPAKKRTLSLSAAERGMLSGIAKTTAVPRVTNNVTTSNVSPS